jgi:SAM-dependent methyltransferase
MTDHKPPAANARGERDDRFMEQLEQRYGTGSHAVVHDTPRAVLIANIKSALDLAEVSDKVVLEIGAGTSLYLKMFLENDCRRLIANDLSEAALRLIPIDDPRFEPLPGDFLKAPIPDNSVDIVFAHLTLTVVEPLLDQFFARIFRLLKPGGLLVTRDINYFCPVAHYRRLRAPTRSAVLKLYSPLRYKRQVTNAGFAVERIVPSTTNHPWTTGNWLLGTTFTLRARRPGN